MNFLKQKWNRLFLSKVEGANQPLAAVSTADLASFQNPITNWGITLVRHFTHARTPTHSHTCTHPHLNLLSNASTLHVSNLSLSLTLSLYIFRACTSEHTCSEYSLTQKQRSLASLYLTLSTVSHTSIHLHPCPCTHHSHSWVCANSHTPTHTRTHTHLHAHTLAHTHTRTNEMSWFS